MASISRVLTLFFLLFMANISSKLIFTFEAEGAEASSMEEMRPVSPSSPIQPFMLNETRRKLSSFQICALCTCCGGPKGLCLPSPCCYEISCNIPNRPFGFCSFIPKTWDLGTLQSSYFNGRYFCLKALTDEDSGNGYTYYIQLCKCCKTTLLGLKNSGDPDEAFADWETGFRCASSIQIDSLLKSSNSQAIYLFVNSETITADSGRINHACNSYIEFSSVMMSKETAQIESATGSFVGELKNEEKQVTSDDFQQSGSIQIMNAGNLKHGDDDDDRLFDDWQCFATAAEKAHILPGETNSGDVENMEEYGSFKPSELLSASDFCCQNARWMCFWGRYQTTRSCLRSPSASPRSQSILS